MLPQQPLNCEARNLFLISLEFSSNFTHSNAVFTFQRSWSSAGWDFNVFLLAASSSFFDVYDEASDFDKLSTCKSLEIWRKRSFKEEFSLKFNLSDLCALLREIDLILIFKFLVSLFFSSIAKKLWWQHVWPCLQQEMRAAEVLAAVLQPALAMVQEATNSEYEQVILPTFKWVLFPFVSRQSTENRIDFCQTPNRMVFASPKSIQATVTLLENLHIILEKTPQNDIRSEVLPLLFNSFESNTMQIQSAALVAVANVYEYVDELSIRRMVLPKIKTVFEKNQSDLKIMANVLQCVERILDKLDKSQIIDEVLPMLYEIRLSDPEIILRVVRKYFFVFRALLRRPIASLSYLKLDTRLSILEKILFFKCK